MYRGLRLRGVKERVQVDLRRQSALELVAQHRPRFLRRRFFVESEFERESSRYRYFFLSRVSGGVSNFSLTKNLGNRTGTNTNDNGGYPSTNPLAP